MVGGDREAGGGVLRRWVAGFGGCGFGAAWLRDVQFGRGGAGYGCCRDDGAERAAFGGAGTGADTCCERRRLGGGLALGVVRVAHVGFGRTCIRYDDGERTGDVGP
ncbi:hypothetical protein ACVNF4_16520 [Streptomyces sp. S6]